MLKALLPSPMRRGGRLAKSWLQELAREARAGLKRPNLYRRDTKERLGAVYTAPTHLSIAERLFLYSLVRGTRPQRVLEIGSALGGSASIMASALEDNGNGMIVGVDPLRRLDPRKKMFYGRFALIESTAPEGFEQACDLAGGSFQLVFYDGPNVHNVAKHILEALVPYLSENAYIVLDNGLHYGVHQAVHDLISGNSHFHDCGFVCVDLGVRDKYAAYHGLRLLRYDANAITNPQPWIDAAYSSAGKPAPNFDPEALNHDRWWCRTVQACPKCEKAGGPEPIDASEVSRHEGSWLE